MSQHKMPSITIPCSNCGDTLKLNPFQVEPGEKIKCPRCEKYFVPSDALIERINEAKAAYQE